MKNYNTDSTANVSRFARDKRQRISSPERVERSPRPQRDADDAGYRQNFERKAAPKRASFNPNFTGDNRLRGEGKPYRSDRAEGERYNRSDDRGRRFDERREYGSYGERNVRRDRDNRGDRRPSYGRYDENRQNDRRRDFRPTSKPYAPRTENNDGETENGRPQRDGFERRQGYGSQHKSYGKPYRQGGAGRGFSSQKPGFKGGKRNAPRRDDDKPRTYPKYNPNAQTGEMRLNRFIAQSGVCSRREADDFIAAGVVSVNGVVVTELGTKIMPTDEVRFNDERLQGEKNVYLVLNKPKGYVTSLEDPHADKTVMDLVKEACTERIYPVGRLDKNSLGLLLFTNDGDLTRQLTHPSYKKKKVYQVSLDKPLTRADMDTLTTGIALEDGEIYADEVAYVKENKKEIGVEIHSGRNRIVRRMFEHLGYTVQKLDRVYYAGLTKKNLKRGAWRFLTREEVMRLKTGQYE